jgi:hypothetical protein
LSGAHYLYQGIAILSSLQIPASLDQEALRSAIADEYTQIATTPDQSFHFHTGRKLARLLDYDEA